MESFFPVIERLWIEGRKGIEEAKESGNMDLSIVEIASLHTTLKIIDSLAPLLAEEDDVYCFFADHENDMRKAIELCEKIIERGKSDNIWYSSSELDELISLLEMKE